jgi:hypothetical protein
MFAATFFFKTDDGIEKSAIQLPNYNGFLAIVHLPLEVYMEFTLIYRGQEQLSQWP